MVRYCMLHGWNNYFFFPLLMTLLVEQWREQMSSAPRLNGKCSKIWDTLPAKTLKTALTNSTDPGQTASEEAV